MLDLVSNAWKESKLKVILVALPIVALLLAAVFLKAYREYLVYTAKKLLDSSVKKDSELTQQADKANSEAEEHKAKADQLAQESKKVDSDDDADWNKKGVK